MRQPCPKLDDAYNVCDCLYEAWALSICVLLIRLT